MPPSIRRRRRNGVGPYLFLAPAVIYLAVFMGIPLVKGIQLSTTNARLLRPNAGKGVGLGNYSDALASAAFYRSLLATGIYTVGTVLVSLVVGTLSAILINRTFRGRWLARAILTFPWAAPTVAAALIFAWIYNNQSGILTSTTRAAVISFFDGWNEFLFGKTFLKQDNWPASVGLSTFIGQFSTPLDQVMMATLIFTIPAIIFFLILQRRIVSGLTAGAVKG